MKNKLILLKDGRNILVSDEEIKVNYVVFQQNFEKTNYQIVKIENEFQAKLGNNKDGSFFKRKIIAGIESLPTLTYSDEVKQILRDKYENTKNLPIFIPVEIENKQNDIKIVKIWED